MIPAFGLIAVMLLGARPGFDCARAGTPTERAICADGSLSQLDSELTAAYAAALRRGSAEHGSLVEAQRAWLRNRDLKCEARTPCLLSWYKDRIAQLRVPTSGAALPLCRSFIRHYRAGLASHAADPSGLPPPRAQSGAGTGIHILDPVARLSDGSVESFSRWGKTISPPLVFDRSPLEAATSATVTIDQVPGERLYAASYVTGTAQCVDSAFFQDLGGRAVAADGPPTWSGYGCGAVRDLGMVDGTLVALEFLGGDSMDLDATVSLSPWEHGRFGGSCNMVFKYDVGYAPGAGSRAPPFDESCDAKGCERFRKDALAAVLAAERSGATDQQPVTTQRVVEGVRYEVSAGQLTMGWRIFTDWKVTFARASDDTEVASVIVHAKRARLREAAAW